MNFLKNDPILKDRRRSLRRKQTDAERAFWEKVRNGRFQGLKFFRQYSVGSYILDFYCPVKRLAVELDGGGHADELQKEYDDVRSAFLYGAGIRVIRFWNHDVLSSTEAVLEEIYQQLIDPPSSGLRPSSPLAG